MLMMIHNTLPVSMKKLSYIFMITFLFLAWTTVAMATSSTIYNIREYGASGDGETHDTEAINKAIETCATSGGGTVLFPPGSYLSGTIHLKSHVSLLFQAGARLIGTTKLDHYTNFTPPPGKPESDWTRWHRALILGDGVEDITITGPGIIDGNKVFDPKGEENMRGPHTVLLGHCSDITISNLTVVDSANYAFLMEDCARIDYNNVIMKGGWDGIHFRGWIAAPCRDITITNCQFYTGDDCIAGRYWDNVLISNCIINSSCNGIRLIGPAEHLIIHDCLFFGPGRYPHRTSDRYNMLAGIILQPGAWDPTEGHLDDVLISDITMKEVVTPFNFVLKEGNTAGRITVNQVNVTGAYRAACSVESWAETPFENVIFRNMSLEFTGGGTLKQADREVKSPGVGARPLPSWGFYARNVKNLQLENINLHTQNEDSRPVINADHVDSITLDRIKFPMPEKTIPLFVFNNVNHIKPHDIPYNPICPAFKKLTLSKNSIKANESFNANVTVKNKNEPGLAWIDLIYNETKQMKTIWLNKDQQKKISFKNLTISKPGTYKIQAAGLAESVTVE